MLFHKPKLEFSKISVGFRFGVEGVRDHEIQGETPSLMGVVKNVCKNRTSEGVFSAD